MTSKESTLSIIGHYFALHAQALANGRDQALCEQYLQMAYALARSLATTPEKDLQNRVAERLAQSPYGYAAHVCGPMAEDLLKMKSDGWVSVFVGDIPGCENCGEPATEAGNAHRCDRCEDLPSDHY